VAGKSLKKQVKMVSCGAEKGINASCHNSAFYDPEIRHQGNIYSFTFGQTA
jgi:hypothetical protein